MKGFTLIEVIFAIFILTMSGFAAFSLIQSSLVPATINRSSLVAYYLAQEGAEIARNIRDNNWLENTAWNEGLTAGDWEADYNDGALSAYAGRYLYISDASKLFAYIASPAENDERSKFQRKITISDVSSGTIEVSVVVYWSERGRDHDISLTSQLTNWR
jgi:type II secretory pathway pseudopilin PulG